MLDNLIRGMVGAATNNVSYVSRPVLFLEKSQFSDDPIQLHGSTYDRDGILADVLEPEKLKVATTSLAVHSLSNSLSDDNVTESSAPLDNEGRVALT